MANINLYFSSEWVKFQVKKDNIFSSFMKHYVHNNWSTHMGQWKLWVENKQELWLKLLFFFIDWLTRWLIHADFMIVSVRSIYCLRHNANVMLYWRFISMEHKTKPVWQVTADQTGCTGFTGCTVCVAEVGIQQLHCGDWRTEQTTEMKTILLALLFFAVVLFVTVECRRSGPGKGKDPKSAKGKIGKLRKLGKRHYIAGVFSLAVFMVNSSLVYFPEILIVFEMQRLFS